MAQVLKELEHLEDWEGYFATEGSREEHSESGNYYPDDFEGLDDDSESNPQPFVFIRQLAEDYGIGAAPTFSEHGREVVDVPGDITWVSAGRRRICTSADVNRLIESCRSLVEQATDCAAAEGLDSAEVEALFENMGRWLGSGMLAQGYAVSDPRTIYRLDFDGEVRKWRTINPCERGLYATLLQLLLPCIDMPPAVLMSLADRSDVALGKLRQPTAIIGDLFADPAPTLNIAANECLKVLEDFRKSNASSDGWSLGERLASLCVLLGEYRSKVKAAFNATQASTRVSDDAGAPGMVSDVEGGGDEAEPHSPEMEIIGSNGLDNPPESDDSPRTGYETHKSWADGIVAGLSDWLQSDPASLFAYFGGVGMPQDDGRCPVGSERRFQDLANQIDSQLGLLCAQTQALGFDSVHGILRSVAAQFPVASRIFSVTRGLPQAEEQASILSALSAMRSRVRDALRIAYGEFRLRGLTLADDVLSPGALDGWAQQHENIRDAIGAGMLMLRNGAPVYNTLLLLQAAVEAMVKRARTTHLSHERSALEIGHTLHLLRRQADERKDRALKFTANAMQALWDLRCLVEHAPERVYSRNHALFLLHGLGVLLDT
jgi:hypothetical protein